jgi:phosphoribosylformylglycinamidine cyclo-ligase
VLTGGDSAAGAVIRGRGSSGVHSNGFSLVRRLATDRGWKLDRPALFDQDKLLIDHLMAPTRIYVASLLPLLRTKRIKGLAHITGGGLLENIPRVLPAGTHARIDADSWEQPRLMAFLHAQGGIEPEEMVRTFNCGIGMAVMCDKETKEYRPVTAFLNADRLAKDVARINDAARSKRMSVIGVSLATPAQCRMPSSPPQTLRACASAASA